MDLSKVTFWSFTAPLRYADRFLSRRAPAGHRRCFARVYIDEYGLPNNTWVMGHDVRSFIDSQWRRLKCIRGKIVVGGSSDGGHIATQVAAEIGADMLFLQDAAPSFIDLDRIEANRPRNKPPTHVLSVGCTGSYFSMNNMKRRCQDLGQLGCFGKCLFIELDDDDFDDHTSALANILNHHFDTIEDGDCAFRQSVDWFTLNNLRFDEGEPSTPTSTGGTGSTFSRSPSS